MCTTCRSDEVEKIWEYSSKCPICGDELRISDYKLNIPYYGDIVISVAMCSSCNFKHNNVFATSSRNPRKILFRVEKPGDENALVIKSSTCTIEIPELGLTLEAGAYSQGYITTVEGIVESFAHALDYLCKQEHAPRDKCNELSSLLEKARNAEVKYTIVIHDLLGVCDVVSEKKPTYEELGD